MDKDIKTDDVIIKFRGMINTQIFPKGRVVKDGDFAIMAFDVIKEIEGKPFYSTYGNVTVKGNFPEVDYNEHYTIVGKEVDSNYGMQYDLLYMTKDNFDASKKEQMIFFTEVLGSEALCNDMFTMYSDPIQLIKDKDIESLKKVNGVGDAVAERLIKKYNEKSEYMEAIVQLAKYDITDLLMKRLLRKYKTPTNVIKKIKENIYIIADEIHGVGFKRADAIALKNGMDVDSILRIEAWTRWYLKNQGEAGNSFVEQKELFKQMFMALVTAKKYRESIKNKIKPLFYRLYDEGELWWSSDKKYIGLSIYRGLEQCINDELIRIHNHTNTFEIDDLDNKIEELEEVQGFKFSGEQRDAIISITKNNLTTIAGLAGVGKTAITTAISKLYDNLVSAQTALSGRAAQRMYEMNGVPSSTIHKLLQPADKLDVLDVKREVGESIEEYNIRVEDEIEKSGYNKNNPMPYNIVIVDEASMIGGKLFLQLLRAIGSFTKVIIVGDNGQLTPIGSCNVFSDILNSNTLNCIKLEEIHRQAKNSGIITMSRKMRANEQLFDKNFIGEETYGELKDFHVISVGNKTRVVIDMVKQFKADLEECDNDIMKVQVLSPLKTNGAIATFNLNNVLQKIYLGKTPDEFLTINVAKERLYKIGVGDKVINISNNYNTKNELGVTTPIFNGNIGVVKQIFESQNSMIIDFDGIGTVVIESSDIRSIHLAYACTVHKYQGSQVDRVIFVADYSAFILLNCEMMYTGVTRAISKATLIGESNAIRYAISHSENKKKNTHLVNLLSEWKEI